jgi:hypothetical protein
VESEYRVRIEPKTHYAGLDGLIKWYWDLTVVVWLELVVRVCVEVYVRYSSINPTPDFH